MHEVGFFKFKIFKGLKLSIPALLQVYEPVEEGSYIKMIDMVNGYGGQLQVSIFFCEHAECRENFQVSPWLLLYRHFSNFSKDSYGELYMLWRSIFTFCSCICLQVWGFLHISCKLGSLAFSESGLNFL